MTLQERLKNLRPYVVGLRFVKEMPVVDVNIKDGWEILENDKISINKSEKVKNYLMFYSEDPTTDIDFVLDFVESCIEHNKEIEAKDILFKTYVDVLKDTFKNNSYEYLKKLEFTFPKISERVQEEKI